MGINSLVLQLKKKQTQKYFFAFEYIGVVCSAEINEADKWD